MCYRCEMAKRPRTITSNASVLDWYYLIKPNTGSRIFIGTFQEYDPLDNLVIEKLINKQSDYRPPTNYHECRIDVSPDTFAGFNSADPNHQLMLTVDGFSMTNTPRTIATELNNNKFWVWENWNGSTTPQPSSIWSSQTIVEKTMISAYYPDQQSIFEQMREQSADVNFVFDKSTQLLTYTGTKPLILPVTSDFNPLYYKSNTNVVVTNTFDVVPPGKLGPIIGTNASKTIWDDKVNGETISWKYCNPKFRLDTIANKLGFMSGSPDDNVHYYFAYSASSGIPNTSSGSVAVGSLRDTEGSIGMIIYPNAKAGPGNVYGAHSTMYLRCQEVFSQLEDQNIVAVVKVSSQPAYVEFQVEPKIQMPLLQSHAINKTFKFFMTDLYNRPYYINSGIPIVVVRVDSKLSS